MKTLTSLFYSLLLCFTFYNSNCQTELWAVTVLGGAYSEGAMIHMNSNGTSLAVAHNFHGPAGYRPYGNLLQASDGNLYGTCHDGGTFGSCTIYKLNPANNSYTDVYSFDHPTGYIPWSGVTEGPNGKLYGVTVDGGANNDGVLYSYDINSNVYTDVHDFLNISGAYPYSPPILHSNGYLYGTTRYGGVNNMGVIYRYDVSTNSYVHVVNFNGVNGAYANGSLIEGANGILYGMTAGGGTNGDGVLFSYTPAFNYYVKLFDFDEVANGRYPMGSLILATDGCLYGMTSLGGGSFGTIFKYNITTNTLTNLHNFDLNQGDGSNPQGDLMQSGNELFGMTQFGGTNGDGIIFKFDITTNIYTKLIDFNGANGQNPYGGFIQLTPTGIAANHANNSEFTISPNPVINNCNITWQGSEKMNFLLYDLSGSEISNSFITTQNNSSATLNLEGISPGNYILEINGKDKKAVKQIMKR